GSARVRSAGPCVHMKPSGAFLRHGVPAGAEPGLRGFAAVADEAVSGVVEHGAAAARAAGFRDRARDGRRVGGVTPRLPLLLRVHAVEAPLPVLALVGPGAPAVRARRAEPVASVGQPLAEHAGGGRVGGPPHGTLPPRET